MYQLHTQYQLRGHTSFAIPAETKYFVSFTEAEELFPFLNNEPYKSLPKMVLGGGSNVIFISDFQGVIFHPVNTGIEIVKKQANEVWVKAAAGENWDDFVAYCVANGFHGLENLSLIPGNVGAAPVQNIGAYGTEVMDFITEVEFLNLETQKIEILSNEQCNFAYRNSIFKQELKNKTAIMYVTFRLSTLFEPNLKYKDVAEEMKYLGKITPLQLRKGIINIRTRKLPDPAVLPNSGSFFKNPIVSIEKCNELLEDYPNMPHYQAGTDKKLAAGWLIEQCGLKGIKMGTAGVYEKQALILVNHHGKNPNDLLLLIEHIINQVAMKFGIILEPEVNIIE